MKETLKKYLKLFLSKQFLTFLGIGCVNTVNGMLFPMLFSLLIENMNIAYMVSYIPSLFISYVLNSIFTFRERQLSFVQYLKFVVSYLPNFAIQNIVFFLVYNVGGLSKLLATVLAAVIGLPVTFLIMKLFTFRKKEEEKHEK